MVCSAYKLEIIYYNYKRLYILSAFNMKVISVKNLVIYLPAQRAHPALTQSWRLEAQFYKILLVTIRNFLISDLRNICDWILQNRSKSHNNRNSFYCLTL